MTASRRPVRRPALRRVAVVGWRGLDEAMLHIGVKVEPKRQLAGRETGRHRPSIFGRDGAIQAGAAAILGKRLVRLVERALIEQAAHHYRSIVVMVPRTMDKALSSFMPTALSFLR